MSAGFEIPVAVATDDVETLGLIEGALEGKVARGTLRVRVAERVFSGAEAVRVSGSLPAGAVLVLDASLSRPEDESPVQLWRDLTEPPEAPPLVLYADDALIDPATDHAFARATGYVGAWRPDAAEKLVEAVGLAAAGVRSRFG